MSAFPVRSRVVGLGADVSDELLREWDAEFARVSTFDTEAQRRRPCRAGFEPTMKQMPDGTWACFDTYNPRQEAMDRERAAAVARIMAPLPYKGHVIKAEAYDGGKKLRWHLTKDGQRLSTHSSPAAAKMAVDRGEQKRQKAEVRSWSDARVSDHARIRGLPSLNLLKAAETWEVKPLKGPITRALEQGHPVTAIPVRTAGGDRTIDVSRVGAPKEKGKVPVLLLAGGAVLVGALVFGGGP